MYEALTQRQRRFVEEYAKDLNATQAATRAGYSSSSSGVTGSKLLKNAKVRAAVDAYLAARSERTEVTVDRVVMELARVAFGDLARVYGADGRLLGVHEMPPEARALVAGIDVEEGEETSVVRKLKTWPKVQALELLGKHLGMFRDKVELSGESGNPVSISINLGAGK